MTAGMGKAGVLAVLERRANFIDCNGRSGNLHNREIADELRQARAAVAEVYAQRDALAAQLADVVEAAECMCAARNAAIIGAREKLRAALARATGAQA